MIRVEVKKPLTPVVKVYDEVQVKEVKYMRAWVSEVDREGRV